MTFFVKGIQHRGIGSRQQSLAAPDSVSIERYVAAYLSGAKQSQNVTIILTMRTYIP